MSLKQSNPKEIIALSTFDAVRMRPTMYVAQISLIEEKLPLVIDGNLVSLDKSWSPGFMHLIIEIFENALDEAKRCHGKMKNISIKVNLDTNEVSVIDEGLGFHNAAKKHKKTKKNVVRTALEELHSGSNFIDSSTNTDSLIGVNGVGAAVVNILSEKFTVETVNKTHYVRFIWNDFKIVDEEIRKKTPKDNLGTKITFIPSKDVFPNYKWDIDLITTYLSFKAFLIKNDPHISKLNLTGYFIKNNKEYDINLTSDFAPDNHIVVPTKLGLIYLWEAYENSCSLSFINGSQCTGIHQKIVNDWCNEYFEYNLAHHFYETLISLNVPPNLMKFADQNKTRYAIGRNEIEGLFKETFYEKLIRLLKKSDIARNIEKSIEERMYSENIGKIKRAQKQSKRKISEKYTPASRYRENIMICEGISASGGVKQARNPEVDAVYALRGKVKNARKISDLATNEEWLDIMGILEIEPGNITKNTLFKKIIIACDSDPDGDSIASMIINFFHKWFPQVIEAKKLYKLITPLVVCTYNKGRRYFYTLEEFYEFTDKNKVTNVNYLKGLGSLNEEDWKYVMQNKTYFSIIDDRSAKKFLEIAFGEESQERKKWLTNK